MKYKIGIDVGGTFTDFLLAYEDGTTQIYKVLSTPDDPSIGLITGLQQMAEDRNLPVKKFIRDVDTIVHGTTVTTNAVLTYRGAKTGLLTTEGLRDTLEMRRGVREEQYNNRFTNAEPLVPRRLRYPVKERLDYQGEVITPLDLEDVHKAARIAFNCSMSAFLCPRSRNTFPLPLTTSCFSPVIVTSPSVSSVDP